MVCDVSKEQECKRFIDSTIETFGGIDILINNAGISMRSLFMDADVDVIRRVMDVNFFGAVYCTKFALILFCKQKVIVRILHCRLPGITRKKRLFRQQVCPSGLAGSHPNRITKQRCTCNVG